MPKEVIQYGQESQITGVDFVENFTDPTLQVKWYRDEDNGMPGWVQVQFEVSEGYLKYVDGVVTSASLSRKEINHLIKTLRRARNAAFGEDE